MLSLSATWACAWLVATLGPARVWLVGGWDDQWHVMLGVIALCLTVSWAWLRVAPIGLLTSGTPRGRGWWARMALTLVRRFRA